MSSDTESRFAHLLQPIRDLADNWNIDIARELEDYLGELEKITFSFDGESNLNFAEAALVIQGSAVVYSKKVEYLYALLYQTLDFLVDKKQKKQQDATDANNEVEEEPDFLSLDDDLEEGKGIDLVEGESAPIRPGRSSAAHISIAMTMASDISEPGNIDSTGDNNSNSGPKKRENFQMNTCMVHSSGALVFDAMASLADDFLRPTSSMSSRRDSFVPNNDVSMANDLNTTTNNNTTQNNEASGVDFSTTGGFDLGGAGAMSDDEDNDGGDDKREGDDDDNEVGRSSIFGQFAAERKESENAKVSGEGVRVRATEGGRREKPKKRVIDLWAMLDPHEEVGAVKPFKKGKPYRIRTASKLAQESGDAVVPILSIAETPHFFRGVKGPDFLEFTYLYNTELKRRKEAKKKDKFEFTFEDTVFAAAEAEEEEEEEIHYRPELSAHFNGATPEVEVETEEAAYDGAADDDDDDVDIGDFGMLDQDDSAGGDTQSYEDFYAQRVEQFMSEAAQYAQESNLSKRVNDWKSKLAPVLDEQESHPSFDMIEYGDTLIHTLRTEYEEVSGVQIEEQGDIEAESDFIIPFAKLTMGVERYEVARRFAAVLQLVNNENVKVVTDHEVDSLGFHLLSVKPKYDIENYRAPSLNPLAAAAAASSSSSSQSKKAAEKTKKAKRGRPSKDEKANKEDGKGKKPAESEEEGEEEHEEVKEGEEESGKVKETGKGKPKHDDKENFLNGKEKRKRKERTFYEPEEEVLKGPRTKMFEVTV